MLINYKNFENENKNQVYNIIKFINKIIDVDIINCMKKSKNSLFKINFNNASRLN